MTTEQWAAIIVGSVMFLLVLVSFAGAWAYSHWASILRWDAARKVRSNMRRSQDRNSANPYNAAFRRGFWYGWIVGAGVVSLAWRIWR